MPSFKIIDLCLVWRLAHLFICIFYFQGNFSDFFVFVFVSIFGLVFVFVKVYCISYFQGNSSDCLVGGVAGEVQRWEFAETVAALKPNSNLCEINCFAKFQLLYSAENQSAIIEDIS